VTSFSGLDQWEDWHRSQSRPSSSSSSSSSPSSSPSSAPRKKLTFNQQREWDTIESKIAEAETKAKGLEAELLSPAIASNAARIMALADEVTAAQAEVERLFARWAELETLRSA
jgi:ATP-binding cassette subfamily F protein uup